MKNESYWRFIPNQNSTIYGINDAGIETFTAHIVHSLVRESIQNSLDAIKDSDQPVIVEFNLFDMDICKFPGHTEFKEYLKKCLESNKEEEDAERFFKKALDIFEGKLQVMRVSDYNTSGLSGARSGEKGSAWSRLVKESGSSNKGQTSGGSFGIGKSAAFACSDLRTVFYSSVDEEGTESNIGVARLISFIDESFKSANNEGWTTGIGYYSDSERLTAILELPDLDKEYVRAESGTDLYIMGFAPMDDLGQEMLKSVLVNFMVSIWKKKLVVRINGMEINKDNLGKHVDCLNPYDSDEIKQLIDYYHLLVWKSPIVKKIELDSNEYGKKYGFKDGECTLLLMEGENLNSRIMMTRSAGMKLFNQDHISGTIDFTGILMVEGEEMNKQFRRMEVPSHDAWEPGRCKEDAALARRMYADLRKYLRQKVKGLFAKAGDKPLDAFGANDFLPDDVREGSKKEKKAESLAGKIQKLDSKEMHAINKRTKRNEIDVDKDPEGDSGLHSGKGGFGKEYTRNGGNAKENGGEKGFQYVEIKERVICRNKKKGIYTIRYVVPNDAKKARMDFIINGEQSDYKFLVKNASVSSGAIHIENIRENRVYFSNIKRNDRVLLELEMDFDQYCLMEVNYFESKK